MLWHEKLGLDVRPDKLLGGHAVVFHKAENRKRERGNDAQPTDGFRAEHVPKTEIHADRNPDGQYRKDELTQRQAHKDRLLIVADFFVDFDFQMGFLSNRHPQKESSNMVFSY